MRASRPSPTLLIGVAAAVTAVVMVAAAADVGTGEHPTHTGVLAATVIVVLGLCRGLAGRVVPTLRAVGAAIIAQPVLHTVSTTQPSPPASHDHADFLHLVVSELPPAVVQIGVPAVVLLAVAAAARLLQWVFRRARRPAHASTPSARLAGRVRVRAGRHGSMLRWCGWVIRAARRGPPRRLRLALP